MSDDQAGRALMGIYLDMVVARCATDPGKLWRGIGAY